MTARTRAVEAKGAAQARSKAVRPQAIRTKTTQTECVGAHTVRDTRDRIAAAPSVFARPLNGPKVLNANTSDPGWPKQMGLALGCVLCGLLLGLSLPDNAQNVPAGRVDTTGGAQTPAAARPTMQRGATVRAARNAAPSASIADAQDDVPTESRRPVSFYTQTVRGSMFSAPLLPAPPAPVVIADAATTRPQPPVLVPPVTFDPLSFWSYTGTITMGDQVMALLENQQSKEGQYVKAGDTFLGAKVVSVSDQMVTLKSGNKPTMLAKSDNITVTPFDRSAAPTGVQQAQQQPNPQQVTISVGGQTFVPTAAPAQPQVTLPNGVQLSPNQFQRRNRRLNNNFNQ